MISKLVRENIKLMKPYFSARQEFAGEASVYLDANENPFGSPLPEQYNRYPDPLQVKLKEKISSIKRVLAENIFLGNGSDEGIDLLIRIFCNPGSDSIVICPPTYGIYEVCASINDVGVKKVELTAHFQLDIEGIQNAADAFTKLLFICSPNNPSGNSINHSDIEYTLRNFAGIVVIDEAYLQYSSQHSFISELDKYPNLVVLQTLSKAWGLAGLRLGMAFASVEIISYFNKIKYPYNINTATQRLALQALEDEQPVNNWTNQVIGQRKWLRIQLLALPFVKEVYPSDANFILIKVEDADFVYESLIKKGIIVRQREGCIRMTVGTPAENDLLIKELKNLAQ
ncbi:MAG: histidinol-phosphate transaminase [Chitinophagaceae bacterium]